MIAFLILLVLITGYMVCAEIVFERDWPRCTIKGFIIALALLFMGFQAFGQASRFDQVVSTINASAPAPGGLYPALYIPGSGINICNAPANAVPCTNYATTYTNAAQSATCTAPTQLTRPGANICVKGADEEGGWGVWMTSGNYQYTITTTYGSFGPYDFSVGGVSGGGVVPATQDLLGRYTTNGLNIQGSSVSVDHATGTIFTAPGAVNSPVINFECSAVAKHQADESLDWQACVTASACANLHIDAMGYQSSQSFSVNPFATACPGQAITVDVGNYQINWNPNSVTVQLPSNTVVHLHNTKVQAPQYAQGTSSKYGMFNTQTTNTTGSISANGTQLTVADASQAQLLSPVAVMGAAGGTLSGNVPGTTLSQSINSIQNEIPLTSISGWPATGYGYINDGTNTESFSYGAVGSSCPLTSASFCATAVNRGTNATTPNSFASSVPVEFFTNNTNQQTVLTSGYTAGSGVLNVTYIVDGTGAGFPTVGTLLLGQGPTAEMVSYSGVNSATCTSACSFTGVTAISGNADTNWPTGTTVQAVVNWTSYITAINGTTLTLADAAPRTVSSVPVVIGSGNIHLDCDRAVIDGGWENFFPTGYSITAGGQATIQAVNNLPAGGGTAVSLGAFTNATYASALNGLNLTVVSATPTSFVVNIPGYSLGASGSISDAGTTSPVVTVNAFGIYALLVNNSDLGKGCTFQNLNSGAVQTNAALNTHIYGRSTGNGHYLGSAPAGEDFLAFGKNSNIQLDIESASAVDIAIACDDRTQHIDPYVGVPTNVQANINNGASGIADSQSTAPLVIQGCASSTFTANTLSTFHNNGAAISVSSIQSTVLPVPINNKIQATTVGGAVIIAPSAAGGNNSIQVTSNIGSVNTATGNHIEYSPLSDQSKRYQGKSFFYVKTPTDNFLDLFWGPNSGNSSWDFRLDASNNYDILDVQNLNKIRLLLTAGGNSELDSGGSGVVGFNIRAGSGTGGVIVGGGDGKTVAASIVPNAQSKFYSGIDEGPEIVRGNLNLLALITPANSAFTTASTGGTLTDSTSYCYRVAARNAIGTTLASTETCATTGSTGSNTNTITVNWGEILGATSYDVYCRTTGAELLCANVTGVGNITWTDTGSATPSGALPGANTTLGALQIAGLPVLPVSGTFTTTVATSESVTLTGCSSTSHPWVQATNATAAALTGVFISSPVTNGFTLNHSATSGGTFNVFCTPN